MEDLPVISLEEVSYHDSFSDCWIVICDRIYNLTNFILQHPGGESVLLDHAGRDATMAFLDAGHTVSASTTLKAYLIGILPTSERLYNDFTKL